MGLLILILLVAAIIYVFKGIIIVQQQQEVIIERMGRYERTLTAGLNFIFPILEAPRGILTKVTQRGFDGQQYFILKQVDRIDKREQMYDFPRQNVITEDNVSITINALIYFQIIDSKSAVYEIANLPEAIEKLTQTNLRNLVGQMDLQKTLTSRNTINTELRTILDEATNKWGVKVNRVEIQDIFPPADIQASMDKLMKADREKTATITEAEGLKEAAIRKAEGEKEAAIRSAEGEKQAEILRAEGVAQARIIEAEAEKEAINRIIREIIIKPDMENRYLILLFSS